MVDLQAIVLALVVNMVDSLFVGVVVEEEEARAGEIDPSDGAKEVETVEGHVSP